MAAEENPFVPLWSSMNELGAELREALKSPKLNGAERRRLHGLSDALHEAFEMVNELIAEDEEPRDGR